MKPNFRATARHVVRVSNGDKHTEKNRLQIPLSIENKKMAVDCDTRDCSAWIASRLTMVLIFALGGLVGNGVVLKVYLKAVKQNPKSSQFYIVLLACIDLYSCVVYLPQIPFLEWGLHSDAHMASQIVLLTQAYMFVQVAMTLDRVFAVFRPHQFNHLRRKTNIGLATLFVISQLVIQISVFVSILYADIILDALTFVTLFALGLIVMLMAYPAITIKLYRQNRRIHQAPATATTNPHLAVQQQKNQQHKKIIKMYFAVLALFLVSFLPMIGLAVGAGKTAPWLAYFHHLNNVGNPVIYYAFNEKFREEVKAILSGVKVTVRKFFYR